MKRTGRLKGNNKVYKKMVKVQRDTCVIYIEKEWLIHCIYRFNQTELQLSLLVTVGGKEKQRNQKSSYLHPAKCLEKKTCRCGHKKKKKTWILPSNQSHEEACSYFFPVTKKCLSHFVWSAHSKDFQKTLFVIHCTGKCLIHFSNKYMNVVILNV